MEKEHIKKYIENRSLDEKEQMLKACIAYNEKKEIVDSKVLSEMHIDDVIILILSDQSIDKDLPLKLYKVNIILKSFDGNILATDTIMKRIENRATLSVYLKQIRKDMQSAPEWKEHIATAKMSFDIKEIKE